MPRSQNVIFRGPAPPDAEFDDPPGASIARLLADNLRPRGWTFGEIENWRDCIWLLSCARGEESLEIAVAMDSRPDTWVLQIAAARYPIFFLRWFGAVPSASVDAIFQLSCEVHAILASSGFADFRWIWDGPPQMHQATSAPRPAKA